MIRLYWHNQRWYHSAARYAFYVGVAACVIFVVWRYGLSERVITSVTVVTDQNLSSYARSSLEDSIKKSFFSDGKYDTSYIKNINFIRKHRNHIAIKCTAHEPALTLRQAQDERGRVVTQNGLLISTHYYRPDIIEALPKITAPSDVTTGELRELVAWIATVPKGMRDTVTLDWKNPTEIFLFFNEYPQHPVIITTQTELSTNTFDAIKTLVSQEHVAQVDARFKDMLVVTQDKKNKKIKNKRGVL